jgi:AcrR family transcriptional regulator
VADALELQLLLLELELDELLEELFDDELLELLDEELEELFEDRLDALLLERLDELLEDRFDELLADPFELLLELLLEAPDPFPWWPPSRCSPTAEAARFMPFSHPLKKRCTGVSPRLACCRLLRELLLDAFVDAFERLLDAPMREEPRAPSVSWAALFMWRTGLGTSACAPEAPRRPATAVTMIPIRFFMKTTSLVKKGGWLVSGRAWLGPTAPLRQPVRAGVSGQRPDLDPHSRGAGKRL